MKNHAKHFALLLPIAAIIIAGAGCAEQIKPENIPAKPAVSAESQLQTPTPTPITIPSPTPTSTFAGKDETADWKTYTNPSSYKINYPGSWSIRTASNSGNTDVDIKKDETTQVPDGYSKPCPANFVMVSVKGPFDYVKEYKTFDRLVTARYDKNGSLGSVSGKKEKLSINGLTAYKFEGSGIESVCGGPAYFVQLNDQKYLTVYLGLNAGNQANVKIASQIAESISSRTQTPAPINETANWLPFKSSYFALSFKIPSGFEVKEGQNYILVAKSPYYTTDIGSDNAFLRLTRYNQNDTRKSKLAEYRKELKNLQESNTVVDGSSFLTLTGDDWGRFEGTSAGKVMVVFFDASWLEIIERPIDRDQRFNPITIGNQILLTFRFSK